MWLSLLHFVYNSIRSSTKLPQPWASNSTGTRTQFNCIIVRRPLDLWNRMFNRHQAEITVMQFRGHSLPVHHSVVYHGNFSCSSHFISQFPPTRFPLITAIRMCYLLPVHHLGMAFFDRVKRSKHNRNSFYHLLCAKTFKKQLHKERK